MRRRPSKTLLVALGLSLAVHALVLAGLASIEPKPPPTLPQAPIEVTVAQWPQPPPAEEPAPPARAAPVRRTQKVSAPKPSPVDAPPAEMEPPTAAPAHDVPRADAPTIPKLSLLPRDLPGDLPVAEPRPVPADAGTNERPAEVIRELTRSTIARGKVDRGLVHPYYAELGKALIRSWDAEAAVSRRGLKGYGEQLIENTRVWNRLWLERAQQFGSTGSPLGEDARDMPMHPPDPRLLPGTPDLAARSELRRQMREQFKATRRATLKVVQEPSGRLLSVELVSPSRDSYVDRQAVEDIRLAAERLPRPPPEAVQGDRLVSLWEFELIVSIHPPVPSFSFEFDEALELVDARLPLDRRIYKRVRLVAVE